LRVLKDNADVVAKYKSGQTSVGGFLIGQVMRETKGRANPQLVREALDKALEEA